MSPELPGRSELQRLDRRADDRGELAELIVAATYDLEHTGGSFEWYDARHPDTGTKYEVKSTSTSRTRGSPGRFRLWEQQHRSLQASDAAGTAWYVFVLFGDSGGIRAVRRRRPSTVAKAVRERDGWNVGGHDDRDGRQHKLPWEEVVDG